MASFTSSKTTAVYTNANLRASLTPRPDVNDNKDYINGFNKRETILEMADAISFVNMMNLFDNM